MALRTLLIFAANGVSRVIFVKCSQLQVLSCHIYANNMEYTAYLSETKKLWILLTRYALLYIICFYWFNFCAPSLQGGHPPVHCGCVNIGVGLSVFILTSFCALALHESPRFRGGYFTSLPSAAPCWSPNF